MLTMFCDFFRNLQAAICSYFEYDQPVFKVPQMSFVKDVTIGEGESVTPNTKFTKTWRLQNSGYLFLLLLVNLCKSINIYNLVMIQC